MFTELIPKSIQNNGTNHRGVDERKFNIRIFNKDNSIDLLQSSWSQLIKAADSPICMSPEWVSNWWKHFGMHNRRSLHIVTVHEEGELISLAPFYTGYSSAGSVVLQRRLQLLGSGGSPNEQWGYSDEYGISDFLDIPVRPGYENEMAGLYSEYLSQIKQDYNRITFNQVREDSFIMRYLYPVLSFKFGNISKKVTDTCSYIDLEGFSTLEEYINSVKPNARRRFRQSLRAEKESFQFEIDQLNELRDLQKFNDHTIRLHQNRWNELGFPGVFHDPRFERFYLDLVKKAYQNNTLWFKVARDRSGVSASRMLLNYNHRMYDYISGFNRNCSSSKYRPGIALLLNAVQDALSQGVKRVELLRGDEGYKDDFTDLNVKNYKVVISDKSDHSAVENMISHITDTISLIYSKGVREIRLIAVQKNQRGILKMLPAYFRFRMESMKMKFRN